MALTKPAQLTTAFAHAGLKNDIPQSATGSNLASYEEGFPVITMQAIADGGMPPHGQDFNGMFYTLTDIARYAQAGGLYPFDKEFCAAIGGYPLGAILMSADGSKLWQNQVAGNANDPDSDDTNWTELCTVDALTAGLATKQGTLTFDSTPTANSSNPVTSGGVKTALDGKQDTLTFDSTPTANSSNPVTSQGILTALNTLSEAQLQALSSAISAIRGTAGSSAALSDYLPLAGGEMIGAIQSTYEGVSVIDGSGIGNLDIVTTDDLYADESDSSYELWRPIVSVKDSQNKRWLGIETFIKSGKHGFNLSTRSAADDEYSELQGFSDGSFKWNGKEIELVNSFDIGEGGGWIRYESGLQICGGWYNSLNSTADTRITFPKAFTVAPAVVTSRTSGVSATSNVAVWKRGSPTTTYFNVYATGSTNMTYIAIGKWK